jgi:uncharacterized protein with LGFP repeats
MSKYLNTKTFRVGETWHKQGEVEEFTSEKAAELAPYGLITPVLSSTGAIDVKAAPKVETAEKKLGNETATQPAVNVAPPTGKGK